MSAAMEPSLSLCMIVRDEARFLGDCLESARPAVDEIVVVDTGSADDTPRIAEDFGAVVLHHDWADDFAAARNAGIERARGSHVLVLDADERLVPGHADALHEACAHPELGVGVLPLHNADALDATPLEVVSGGRSMGEAVQLPRLFPNHPALRYRGRVHEVLVPDLRWLRRAVGGRPIRVDAPIVHYGELPELRAERGKLARNVGLMERALEEDPADVVLAGYLAGEYYLAGRRADAEALAERHLPGLFARTDAAEGPGARPCPVRLASVLALCLAERGAFERALDVARATRSRAGAEHPNPLYVEGLALEGLGRYDEAADAFQRCIEIAGGCYSTPVFRGITGLQGRLRLTSCLLAQGYAAEALEHLPGARGPALVPAALLRAEAHLALDEPHEALRWLGPLGRLVNPPADLYALAHRALEAVSQTDAALGQRARELPAERWLEPRRRRLVGA